MRLGVNVRHAEEQLRGTLALPHGLGKDVTIAVFAEGDQARAGRRGRRRLRRRRGPRRAGRGGLDRLRRRDRDPGDDGPGGLASSAACSARRARCRTRRSAPSPTTSPRPSSEAKAGKVEYRTDRQANIHLTIGKASFDAERALLENYAAVIDEIVRAKPAASKGRYLHLDHAGDDDGPRRPRRPGADPRVGDPGRAACRRRRPSAAAEAGRRARGGAPRRSRPSTSRPARGGGRDRGEVATDRASAAETAGEAARRGPKSSAGEPGASFSSPPARGLFLVPRIEIR